MAPQEAAHHLLRIKDGDGDGDVYCNAFEPSERLAIVSSRITFDCGSPLPSASSHRGNQLLLTDDERISAYPKNIRWDVRAHQNSMGNILYDLAARVQTFNVHGTDGKIAAKLQILMRRTSAMSIFLDVKLCVRGNDLSLSSCSISRSFLLNKTHLPRTPFRALINKEKKNLPLLQWYNNNSERQKGIHEDKFIYDHKNEMEQLKHDAHHTRKEATKSNNENSKLQEKLGYNKSMHITSLENEVIKLKEKLTQQSRELKVCHDRVLELKGNIRVFCRCRPLTSDEVSAGDISVVEFNSVVNNELCVHTHEGVKKPFKFDCVFTPLHNQEDVFRETAPLVVSVLDGFNVCIFAYGQTGTGKTFTMEGSKDNRGVNYRTLEKLFHLASERKGQCRYDISVSVLEIYNEEIRDLLTPSPPSGQSGKKLEIKRVAEGTHHLPGVVEATVHSIEDVWNVLQTGSRTRVVGCTNANKHSSRSHCMLCVMVNGENSLTGECTKSKLWLVDLAGSERIGKTDVQGDRLKEAQSINKSLSALGDVIHALASKSSHIPYRNSKLTHLLQDSLGGQAKTLMFVQISPSEQDVGETLCSLNFASRVRGVELGVARKQLDPAELLKYKKLAEKAKQDGFLKDETIKELQEAAKVKEQTCKALSAKVKEKENLFEAEKKARSMAEGKLREQHTLIEKQKQMIEKLSAEIKAKQSGLLQEPTGQKILPALKPSTPRRPPLLEKLTDNRGHMLETNQRPKKRAAEGYEQKENATDVDVLPSKTLPRRASMITMPHQWPSTPAAVPLLSGLQHKRTAEGYVQKENACCGTDADVLPSKTLPRRASMTTMPHQWRSTPAVHLLSGPLPKRRALQHGAQEDAPEEILAPRTVSRHQGRASLCVLPQRQPSSWALAAPSPSPLVKFAEPRRRRSVVCPAAPASLEVGENMPASMIVSPAIGHIPSMALREPQKILFKSPQQHQPRTLEYTTNADLNNSNAVGRGRELQGMMTKARRVSDINVVAHGKPPQHPHQVVNRELQFQPKRLNREAGEEVDDRLKKMRRLTTVAPFPWERPPQPWALLPTPATPSREMTTGDGQRMLGVENTRPNANQMMASSATVSLTMAPSLPKQLWIPTPPATPSHIPVYGVAQRVPVTSKKSGFQRRQVSNERERGWNR